MIPNGEAGETERQPAVTRLRNLARYVSLVADEMEALYRHDAPRLRELTDERHVMEVELGPVPDDEGEAEDQAASLPISDELCRALSEAVELLERLAEESHQERNRWLVLGDDALRSLQGARLRAAHGGQYVEFSSTDARVDVRF